MGFQAAVQSRFVVRNGQWFPILAELTGQGSQAYVVELRCTRADLDGDQVDYVEPHVAVTPEAGIKRVWCYAVSLKENAGEPMKLDIIGDDGMLITSLPVPAFEPISNDTQLILDISEKRVTGLGLLDSGAVAYMGPSWGQRPYYRSICVASLPWRDLPDRWWGLEAVDVIVWDEPDPDALSIPQLTALIDWVRNGGLLVVGIGPAWTKIQKSALAEIMPLQGNQPAAEVRQLRTFAGLLGRPGAEGFKAPISVAVGDPAPGAMVTLNDRLPDGRIVPLITLRNVGSGRVIMTAARLRDLGAVARWRDFLRELFDLNPNETAFREKEGEEGFLGHAVRQLYDPLIAQIEFRRLASVTVLAAVAFVAAYVLLSTFGVWNWLKRHALAHTSWTVFAAFAVAASLLSLGAVGLSRGVTGTVHSFSFVDLEAGSSEARATTYFGYKSNRRQRVDLSLPGESNYLRPLATGSEIDSAEYATSERYDAIPSRAILAGALMRATLKQFEGVWCGSLEGEVRGRLIADRDTGKITPESWLQSDLDAEIIGGYLLYIDPRLRARDGGVPYRVAGLTTRNDRPLQENKYYGSDRVPPAVNVLAVAVPPIEPGVRVDQLGSKEYGEYDTASARWNPESGSDAKKEPMLATLRHCQLGLWAPSLGTTLLGTGVQPRDAAALMASTRDLHLHNASINDFDEVGDPISAAGLVDQDVTHWLTRGQAVLLLVSGRPGPAKLHLNGNPSDSKEGRALYRVRIPIEYAGQPPRGTAP